MPSRPLQPGDPDRLAGYTLDGRLGEGGQGTVYLGRDADGRVVAVKLLRAALLEDPGARTRFIRELAAAQRVARFCTAQVLDADLAGDRPYIVSEYVDGPSLQEVVARTGPRQGVELERLAIGTATALAAIHEAGIVHCDLKPGNVLLAPDGPRVIDFGIARALDASGTASQVIGTPAYMAPEQMSLSAVSPAVDVFAWGATMAFAVNGSSPFMANSAPSTMYRVLEGEPDLGGLTGPMRLLVARCLAKDPAARPTSRELLLELLGTGEWAGSTRPLSGDADGATVALERGTIRAAGATAVASPLPPAGRRRGRLLAGAAVAVVLLAGAVAAFVFWPSLRPALTSAPEITSVPAAFAGDWTGSGALPLEGTDVYPSLTLPVGARRTEIRSGESSCASGTLTFQRADATTLEMDFRSEPGCPAGTMTFQLTGPDQLDMYLGAEASTSYYATLTR